MLRKDHPPVTYYSWEGDACPLHTGKDGGMTADLYRGGKGIIPMLVTDILFGAFEISEAAYQELVGEETGRRAQGKAG